VVGLLANLVILLLTILVVDYIAMLAGSRVLVGLLVSSSISG
jgi:hypothetical protein